jgi:hypothetical protein
VALVGFTLFYGGLRLARSESVIYYTEGSVLGSLAALEAEGSLPALYPADGWGNAPTVLTLYPPTYFLLAAGADAVAGTGGTLFGLRLVSLAALVALLLLLARLAYRRRAPPAWLLGLLAAALLTPGVYTVVGAAQADVPALLFTWVGLVIVIADPTDRRRVAVAAAAFLLAFFTKQSFVAAPAALAVFLFLRGRRIQAVAFAASLCVVAVVGVLLLNGVTAGGYVANTVGALTGSAGWGNLISTLVASGPVQWVPLLLVVLLAVRGRLRPGLPELYVVSSTILHTTAMLKTGSSVNYLLEPTFALLLLGVCRSSPTAREPGEPAPRPEPRAVAPTVAVALALTVALTAGRAAWLELGHVRTWVALEDAARMSDFEGHPLTDVYFFPAVLARGGRPWLNDPFAFGVLEDTGAWDPAGLVRDLESHRVPFALTMVHPGPAPAPPGAESRDLVMAYFWRSRPIWTALMANYRVTGAGPLYLWVPVEEDVR